MSWWNQSLGEFPMGIFGVCTENKRGLVGETLNYVILKPGGGGGEGGGNCLNIYFEIEYLHIFINGLNNINVWCN